DDHRGVDRHHRADDLIREFRGAGGHQVLRDIRRELAEHHGAQHAAYGEAHQPIVLEQNSPDRQKRYRRVRRVRRAELAVAENRINHEET
nr:hypothetical protein [Tanacetum cinerariifolium]